ncbi:LysR family transcriptional regulator [Roseococcus microcysteis]|uniref:LysR family transcriptional regulator n=1 Tax=Roseococcus microcysteis TaxID=2771361 RepID=UPI00168BDD8B|nr:LysR family transcriptional regulator [Roseococcus microcysteis]
MELRDITLFLAAARTLNFTRAAEECGVSQPSLSRAIQRLEHTLGGPLFARERGRTHLTALGRLVLPRLSELAERSAAIRNQAALHHRLQSADLRLGILCSIGPGVFAGFLAAFRSAQPGIDITLHDARPDRLTERLQQGELDAALMPPPAAGAERFSAEPLYEERYMVACAAGHRFAARESITMADMHGETYLLRINCENRETLGAGLTAAGAKLRVACLSEREDWIQGLVAAGMGVCFLPEYSAAQPSLVLRAVEDAPLARRIALVTVPGRRWSAPLTRFIEALRATRLPMAPHTGNEWNPCRPSAGCGPFPTLKLRPAARHGAVKPAA